MMKRQKPRCSNQKAGLRRIPVRFIPVVHSTPGASDAAQRVGRLNARMSHRITKSDSASSPLQATHFIYRYGGISRDRETIGELKGREFGMFSFRFDKRFRKILSFADTAG